MLKYENSLEKGSFIFLIQINNIEARDTQSLIIWFKCCDLPEKGKLQFRKSDK